MNNSEVLRIIDQKLDSINIGHYLEVYTLDIALKKQMGSTSLRIWIVETYSFLINKI